MLKKILAFLGLATLAELKDVEKTADLTLVTLTEAVDAVANQFADNLRLKRILTIKHNQISQLQATIDTMRESRRVMEETHAIELRSLRDQLHSATSKDST